MGSSPHVTWRTYQFVGCPRGGKWPKERNLKNHGGLRTWWHNCPVIRSFSFIGHRELPIWAESWIGVFALLWALQGSRSVNLEDWFLKLGGVFSCHDGRLTYCTYTTFFYELDVLGALMNSLELCSPYSSYGSVYTGFQSPKSTTFVNNSPRAGKVPNFEPRKKHSDVYSLKSCLD